MLFLEVVVVIVCEFGVCGNWWSGESVWVVLMLWRYQSDSENKGVCVYVWGVSVCLCDCGVVWCGHVSGCVCSCLGVYLGMCVDVCLCEGLWSRCVCVWVGKGMCVFDRGV